MNCKEIVQGVLAQSKAMRPRIEVEIQDTQAKLAQLQNQLKQVDADIEALTAATTEAKEAE